jgi:S-formylglutathione hydrolase
MTFAIYVPDGVEKAPVLYWLSGLTCTHETFTQKTGMQRLAAKYELVVVVPDTSPRGCGIEGEDDDWDFGSGAGFYLNATEEKWKKNYNMYSYITQELPDLITANFNVDPGKQSIFGHRSFEINILRFFSINTRCMTMDSMGGHGAIICALKNPGMYRVRIV